MEKIMIPGELLWDEETRVPNTYVEDGKTYATVMGMLRDNKFVALQMVYHPKPGDNVVGVVTDVRHSGFSVDLNLPYNGFISSKFTRVSFKQGDLIFGRIKYVDEVGNADITDAKRLPAGKLLDVPASKVPRIIGKKSSMLNVIRDGTGCSIFVGNNGYIWIGGKGNLQLALKTMDLIIEKAHTSGLTDIVASYLNENGGNVTVPPREHEITRKPENEKGHSECGDPNCGETHGEAPIEEKPPAEAAPKEGAQEGEEKLDIDKM